MKTDDLIGALAADIGTREGRVPPRLAVAALIGGAGASAAFLSTMGVRPDVSEALSTWRFVTKLGIVALAMVTGFLVVVRLASPLERGRALWLFALVLLALAAAVGAELANVPATEWGARLVGDNASVCLMLIPGLAVIPLAAGLQAMRAGAPSSPALAGGAVGMLSGAIAAAVYGLHCTDDSPLFVATWYTLAIVATALIGAIWGRFVLRW